MIKNILFVHNGISFFKPDLEILKKYFNVDDYNFENSKNIFVLLFRYLKFLIFLLKNLKKYDLFFIWFADYHSFLPVLFSKLFHKKSIINLGGYDVTYIPFLKYGAFSNPIRSFATGFSIHYANINLAVAQSLKKEALKRVPKAKISVIPTGYDFKNQTIGKNKENIILTVGRVDSFNRFIIKGIDFFVKLAKEMPKYKFIAIGLSEDSKRYIKTFPENLIILPQQPKEILDEYYSKAKIYAQFSLREGFPSAVCEAMLHGCIPIGTNVGAMKEIIGDTGFILENRSIEKAKIYIKQAMNFNITKSIKSSNRIKNNFSLEKREKQLISIFQKLNSIH